VDDEDHRRIAVASYNRCWELLEGERSDDDDRELLMLAFVSRYHWTLVGGEEQAVIGDWMISRAAAAIGDGALSLNFAQHALDVAQDSDVPDWLLASVHEGLARAYAANGDARARDEWYAAAAKLVDQIDDDEWRSLIADQLDSVPPPPSD
jgi:hypothetical protein